MIDWTLANTSERRFAERSKRYAGITHTYSSPASSVLHPYAFPDHVCNRLVDPTYKTPFNQQKRTSEVSR
jgi:hypothetical protein